ncbi:hypothetical protein [Mesonia aquimarina]|uniref:hypothetical protein n=1 Tax=Mesonia aquimarina TaxID=1504967 RepID=UPI000EF611D4|nr:hypothetical protein [Mesonia aquimarina]
MSTKQTTKEETDVIDLYELTKKVFYKTLQLFFRFINFLIRNIVIIAILIAIGGGLGYFLDKNKPDIYKTEFIVATDFDAAEYLYKSIEELKFGLKHYNDSFMNELEIPKEKAAKINLDIEPIVVLNELNKEEQAYAEFLDENIEIEQKERLYINSVKRHKLTLYHPDDIDSKEYLTKIIKYLRKNDYYQDLYSLYEKEANRQYKSTTNLLSQIDSLVINYSNSFRQEKYTTPGVTYFNSGTVMDLGMVLENRTLIQDDVNRLLENTITSTEFLKIIDKGSPRNLEHFNPFSRKMYFYPVLLVLIFILIKLIRVIYRKAKALS